MLEHKATLNVCRPGCLYKTEFGTEGITNYYCISIGFHKGQKLPEINRICHSENLNYAKEMLKCHIVGVTKTFKKIPYKQVYPNEYTQSFKYVKISVFTPYWAVDKLPAVIESDMRFLRQYISLCTL